MEDLWNTIPVSMPLSIPFKDVLILVPEIF